jgi:uncharacterized HAD superfamily protein
MTQESRTLCIDIDGTIAQARADLDYARCEPVPGAAQALRELRTRGWFIVLHTARHINRLTETVEWLHTHEFEYDHIVMGKPTGRHYIDDRGIHFAGDWKPILEQLPGPRPA